MSRTEDQRARSHEEFSNGKWVGGKKLKFKETGGVNPPGRLPKELEKFYEVNTGGI